jgi:prepilin-type N-terminal cleavage/methylation domain-containing protein
MIKNKKNNAGFSLIENLIALAIFVLLAIAIFQISALFIRTIGTYREDIVISNLASQYMEIVHNLPYSNVGTINGNPSGNLPDLPNAPQETLNGYTYQIYYVVNYIDDPADGTITNGNDFAPNDYKQVKLYVKNLASEKIYDFVTNITPKGLENLDNAGALSIKAFNAIGQPVPNATINIINTSLTPHINLTRTTDANGNWIEVGLPNGENSYHISVTKTGYSSDQTYTSTVSNPNPTKSDSTIINGQVTQVSFSIDKLSSLSFQTLDQSCSALQNIGINIQGSKIIGSNPKILKYNHNYTSNESGNISLGSVEWDNYTPTLTDPTKMIYGSSPIQEITILPNTNQNFSLILGPKTTNSLLVIVKDSTTGNPLEGANVNLKNLELGVDLNKITGGSVWNSNDWSGGAEQNNWTDETKYFSDEFVSANITPQALRLISYNNGQTYATNGSLISSTYDTGTEQTIFTTLDWKPTSQNASTSIKFQIATSNDASTSTWNFIGPDGTSATYYNTPQTTINSPSARYIRYKTYLSTTDNTKTPVLTNININYVSGCFTPGQTIFSGLEKANDYQTTISLSGYTTQIIDPSNIDGNKTLEILLSH